MHGKRRADREGEERGRDLAATRAGDTTGAGSGTAALPPERCEALRRWIREGGANDPDAVRRLAERLLDLGVLE